MSDTLSSETEDGPVAEASAPASDGQFVTFSVGDEMFAVPMAPVQEIIRMPEVAHLPMAPRALAGLSNLRGRVLPIVNLRSLFSAEARPHDDATRVLVINLGQPLGFVVDRVASVISVQPEELQPARQVQTVVRADYLSGVINRSSTEPPERLMLVLDFDRLIREEFAQVQRADGPRESGGLAPASAVNDDSHAPVDELRLVSFSVAGQEYAIDIASVQEIVQVPPQITAVPNTPAHVLGLISLRQRLLPLVSLRSLFGLPTLALDEHHRIVVIAVPGGGRVGLVTDAVKEVLGVPRQQADAMPGVLARDAGMAEFESICRLDGGRRLVSIIATDRLLGLSELSDALGMAAHAATSDAATDSPEDPAMNRPASPREGATDDDLQVVVFRLGAEEFGVPIMSVQEIVRVPEVLTRVPKTPPFVEGVINLRGTVLPVIDQRARLGLPAVARSDRQRIMVYTLGGVRTGFIVDSVAEVLRIPRAQIAPAPELSAEQARLITEVAKLDGDRRLVMLIDPNHVLAASETQALQSSAPAEAPLENAPLARAA